VREDDVNDMLVLLGDSIFDNTPYVPRGADVLTQLRALVPASTRVEMLARDGARMRDLPRQLQLVPHEATHVLISIGGNDVLQHVAVLDAPARSVSQALLVLAERVATFEREYAETLAAARSSRRKTTVCTIYEGALAPSMATAARTALALFNDAIVRTASELQLDLIELRLVCTETADYVSAIEPSAQGAAKIARRLHRAVYPADEHSEGFTRLWGPV